jgi:LPXTG-motif cell wall-anchored protein
LLGVLLFQRPAPAIEPVAQPVAVAAEEPPANSLPKTASAIPLMGLLGVFAFAGSFGLRAIRRKVTA